MHSAVASSAALRSDARTTAREHEAAAAFELRGFRYQSMDFTRQSPRAQAMHSTYLADKEKTCIDCHKGIAHRLPDMGKAGEP